MLKKIQNLLYPQLAGKSFKDDDELYLFLVLGVAGLLAGMMHVILLVLTLSTGVMLLAIVNLFSILIYGVCFALNLKRQYLTASLLITVEVMIYTALSIYLIGIDSYVFLFLLISLVLQLIIPYAKTPVRAAVVAVLWGAMVAAVVVGGGYVPAIQLGKNEMVYTLVTINLVVVAIIVELSIGFFIKKLIVHYNEKRLQDMTNQAYTDSLTGLLNRRYAEIFFETLRNDRRGNQWCVAILDLDDFKQVNDLNGHLVGDAVLRKVAETLRASLRKSDVVFRWGGEEFLLFLDNVELATAHTILEKLRINLAQTVAQTPDVSVRCTATIGVVELDPADLQGSISRCDQKLYEGKNSGKNRVVK